MACLGLLWGDLFSLGVNAVRVFQPALSSRSSPFWSNRGALNMSANNSSADWGRSGRDAGVGSRGGGGLFARVVCM